MIREQDPLKQGLKLFSKQILTHNPLIREQDPLKQGLKLPHFRWLLSLSIVFVSKIH